MMMDCIQAASEVAMKSARIQTQKDLKKAAKKGTIGAQALSVRRKVHWFEKFHWFLTSDNFLVVGGRDAQQNEVVCSPQISCLVVFDNFLLQIVRRYLNANDLYFHADLHGASSVILLNPEGIDPIPHRSLEVIILCI
jgi:predicted ribosome quality control (RQC) complex YloA/Tae2 family protein